MWGQVFVPCAYSGESSCWFWTCTPPGSLGIASRTSGTFMTHKRKVCTTWAFQQLHWTRHSANLGMKPQRPKHKHRYLVANARRSAFGSKSCREWLLKKDKNWKFSTIWGIGQFLMAVGTVLIWYLYSQKTKVTKQALLYLFAKTSAFEK